MPRAPAGRSGAGAPGAARTQPGTRGPTWAQRSAHKSPPPRLSPPRTASPRPRSRLRAAGAGPHRASQLVFVRSVHLAVPRGGGRCSSSGGEQLLPRVAFRVAFRVTFRGGRHRDGAEDQDPAANHLRGDGVRVSAGGPG